MAENITSPTMSGVLKRLQEGAGDLINKPAINPVLKDPLPLPIPVEKSLARVDSGRDKATQSLAEATQGITEQQRQIKALEAQIASLAKTRRERHKLGKKVKHLTSAISQNADAIQRKIDDTGEAVDSIAHHSSQDIRTLSKEIIVDPHTGLPLSDYLAKDIASAIENERFDEGDNERKIEDLNRIRILSSDMMLFHYANVELGSDAFDERLRAMCAGLRDMGRYLANGKGEVYKPFKDAQEADEAEGIRLYFPPGSVPRLYLDFLKSDEITIESYRNKQGGDEFQFKLEFPPGKTDRGTMDVAKDCLDFVIKTTTLSKNIVTVAQLPDSLGLKQEDADREEFDEYWKGRAEVLRLVSGVANAMNLLKPRLRDGEKPLDEKPVVTFDRDKPPEVVPWDTYLNAMRYYWRDIEGPFDHLTMTMARTRSRELLAPVTMDYAAVLTPDGKIPGLGDELMKTVVEAGDLAQKIWNDHQELPFDIRKIKPHMFREFGNKILARLNDQVNNTAKRASKYELLKSAFKGNLAAICLVGAVEKSGRDFIPDLTEAERVDLRAILVEEYGRSERFKEILSGFLVIALDDARIAYNKARGIPPDEI
ncbi:hypothetical protein HGB07_01640 [Candidatus Roizmanbacteria bacterium]|nr:hypothetical protein [Candidatus Roizmanbacteria bacterium]